MKARKAKTGIAGFLDRQRRIFGKVSEKAKETNSCAICIEDFTDDSEIAELNCAENHIFHIECIQGWFEQQKKTGQMNCPMCRTAVKFNV